MKCLALLALIALAGAVQVPAADLTKLAHDELVQLLRSDNSWQRRQAQQLLSEKLTSRDRKVIANLVALAGPKARTMKPAPSVPTRLAALDVLYASGTLTAKLLDDNARDSATELRVWVARFTGELGEAGKPALKRLEKLAADPEPTVRGAVAVALRQLTGGSLTVNRSPKANIPTTDLVVHFKALLSHPSVEGDSYYPHIVWMAMEPRVAADPQPFLPLVSANENSVSAYCLRRVMRRICDLTDSGARTKHLNAAMEHLAGLAPKTALAEAALDGLIDAFKSKGQPPTIPLEPIFTKLTANPTLADKARRLATLLGDTAASRSLIAKINDANATLEERLKGITAARETKDDTARGELLRLLKAPLTPALSPPRGEGVATERAAASPSPLGGERAGVRGASDDPQRLYPDALRALGTFGGDDIAYAVTDAWKNFSPGTRRVASEVLVLRSKWSRALLAAVDQKLAKPEDVSATARRALARSEDATVREHADRVLGKYRAPGEDKLKLIAEKRKLVLAAEPDLQNGYEVAKRTCFVCHKLHGEGMDVGPDLTGVGRSTLDALLHNVIDPNEVVGNGNEATEVELNDGTTVSGRIVEDSPTRLKLLASGATEHVIARSDIAVDNGKPRIRTSQLSLMPEGLEVMPEAEFRNLIWYILNPPQDNRPLTPALRRELLGDEGGGSKEAEAKRPEGRGPTSGEFRGRGVQPGDGESVALWNVDWKVFCPPFEGAPKKLPEFAGRKNVLMTHPVDRNTPAALERSLEIPAGQSTRLTFSVAADDQGDWELRVRVDGQLLQQRLVTRNNERWLAVSVDLSSFAGKTVTLRLENFANDWNYEFAYWNDVTIKTLGPNAKAP